MEPKLTADCPAGTIAVRKIDGTLDGCVPIDDEPECGYDYDMFCPDETYAQYVRQGSYGRIGIWRQLGRTIRAASNVAAAWIVERLDAAAERLDRQRTRRP